MGIWMRVIAYAVVASLTILIASGLGRAHALSAPPALLTMAGNSVDPPCRLRLLSLVAVAWCPLGANLLAD